MLNIREFRREFNAVSNSISECINYLGVVFFHIIGYVISIQMLNVRIFFYGDKRNYRS